MNTKNDSQESVPQYDVHITPAESAARQHREGKDFGHTPHDQPNGEQAAQKAAERAHELQELSEDEDGKLTTEHDWRHKGPGLI